MSTRKHHLFISLLLTLTSLISHAINPGCRCIRFVSTFGKEWGSFGSPDYPAEYPRGIPCLLYLFSAPGDFIVQLNFSQIHLPNSSNGCHEGDYVKLFLHLEQEGVNESTPWNSLICGERTNETYFSASRHLVIQFHSASTPILPPSLGHTPLGFNGYFRFLNASQFESNGRLVAGTRCDFQFESRNYSSPDGKFFSPYYPSNYPHNVMCAYTFRARAHERVKVVFQDVALEPGQYSCLNKTDVIRVLDGSDSRSPVISLLCNSVKDYEMVSSGLDLRVEFIGNSGSPGRGFRAKFHFIKKLTEDPLLNGFNLQQYFPKHVADSIKKKKPQLLGEDGQPQASTLVPQCDVVIWSDSGVNGSISSPNYPAPYQPKSHCNFDLIGHGRQRVQISFVDFDLLHTPASQIRLPTYNNDNESSRCQYSDSVSSFVFINGERLRLLEHCGPNPPPDMMSHDHRMTLEFSAKASATPSGRGFYALYSFVDDFGLKSGLQASEYPCAFILNISASLNGSIESPNHPGLYPRGTECHYFFHGDSHHNYVLLSFSHFDLSGTYPCNKEGDDFLEYSNYMPTDGRYRRKCGQRSPLPPSSSSSVALPLFQLGGGGPEKFFRVTFTSSSSAWGNPSIKSGGGSGFKASYIFTHQRPQLESNDEESAFNSSRTRRMTIFSYNSMVMVLVIVFHLNHGASIHSFHGE